MPVAALSVDAVDDRSTPWLAGAPGRTFAVPPPPVVPTSDSSTLAGAPPSRPAWRATVTSNKGLKRTPEQKARRRLVDRKLQPPCALRTRAGAPCRSFAIGTDGGCFTHTQDAPFMARRRATSLAGGRGNGTLVRASRLLMAGPFGPLVELLVRSMAETYEGTLDPLRMGAIAQGMRSLVVARDSDQASRIIERLEAQIAAMESGEDERRGEVWVGEYRDVTPALLPAGDEEPDR